MDGRTDADGSRQEVGVAAELLRGGVGEGLHALRMAQQPARPAREPEPERPRPVVEAKVAPPKPRVVSSMPLARSRSSR